MDLEHWKGLTAKALTTSKELASLRLSANEQEFLTRLVKYLYRTDRVHVTKNTFLDRNTIGNIDAVVYSIIDCLYPDVKTDERLDNITTDCAITLGHIIRLNITEVFRAVT